MTVGHTNRRPLPGPNALLREVLKTQGPETGLGTVCHRTQNSTSFREDERSQNFLIIRPTGRSEQRYAATA
jgi:hypothetical protein